MTYAQKIQYLNKTENEYKLMDNVLMPLFQNMNKFIKVIKTHGTDEKGKDFVLISNSTFGGYKYTAVIVKNEDITNASQKKEKEIVSTVISQIVMCLNSGYDSIEEKRKVYFSDILVVTSGVISNSARMAFVQEAENHKFNAMNFMEDKDLVNLIDLYLPEIYLINSGALSKYFHSLREKCSNVNELKKISIYKGGDKSIGDIYIEPKLYKRKENVKNGKTVTDYDEDRFCSIISKTGRYLITGNAGSGKSTLLRSEVCNLITEYELDKSKVIPLYIRIKSYAKNYCCSDDIKTCIKSYLIDEYNISADEYEEIIRDGIKLLYLFDGYDELSLDDEKSSFAKTLSFLDSEKQSSIVITSRKSNIILKDNFKLYSEWNLAEFNIKQITQFFAKWFRGQKNDLLRDLKDHDLLEKLPNTPLVMTLIAILFESDQNVEIPSNLSELYKMFTELLLGRWNLDRRIDNMYQANYKETFLTELALYLHQNNKLSCSIDEVMNVFSYTTTKLGRKFDSNTMLDELIRDTNLICEDEKGEFEFRHLSFQEYFVADYLRIKNKIDELIEVFPHPWWNQVLYFYCGLRKENDDLLPGLSIKIEKMDSKKKLLAILHMGYLLQSSYKTDAKIRKILITEQLLYFANATSAFLDSIEEASRFPDILKYITLIELFKTHYGSIYLDDIYEDLLSELALIKIETFEQAYVVFLLVAILARNGNIDVLVKYDYLFKDFPMLMLIEDFILRCDLLDEIESKEQREKAKEVFGEIRKRIKRNPQLFKNLLK